MIQFNNVSKQYRVGNIALDKTSFEISDNEFLFLVGHSGAGKTTILKLILRQILPTTGSVIVNELDISDPRFNKKTELRRTLGVVFQDFKVLFDKNVFENVALSLKVANTQGKSIQKQVDEVLALVGIEDKKFMFPMQLSAGELQRVAIARAIVGGRQIILADEPTGNLDSKTAWEIMKIFKKLEGKKTIVIATHNVDIVNSFKKRVLTLVDGTLLDDRRKGTYKV